MANLREYLGAPLFKAFLKVFVKFNLSSATSHWKKSWKLVLRGVFKIFLFFNYSFVSILFCISFRCTSQQLDNHVLYKMFPPIFPVRGQFSWRAFDISSHCINTMTWLIILSLFYNFPSIFTYNISCDPCNRPLRQVGLKSLTCNWWWNWGSRRLVFSKVMCLIS